MNTNDNNFLNENFHKRLSLRVTLQNLNKIQEVWIKEEGEKICSKYPEVFSTSSLKSAVSKDWIYVQKNFKDKETFNDFEFGICYDENYKCGQYLSFYPYAGVHLKKKTQLSTIEEFFKNNISKTITKDFSNKDNWLWTGEQGVWICFGEDCFNEDWGELKDYAKDLNELSEQLNKLCNEVIRLVRKYK